MNMSLNGGLSPPPLRNRASSTSASVRPALTLCSLRQQSQPSPEAGSSLRLEDSTPSPELSTPSMLLLFASRVLEFVHVHPKQNLNWSTPSSPRSSTDDFVLPISASPTASSFSESFPEKVTKAPQSPTGWHGIPSVHAPIFFVIMLLPLSTALVFYCLSTLPVSMSWPRTLTDLAQLGRELHAYSQSGPGPMAHVIGVMAITAVWKHAWSIPGSVIWNVLAGALFSPAYATILLTTLTTLGSVCATMLATPLAPFLTHFFPRALDLTRNALEGDSKSDLAPSTSSSKPKSSAWVRLSVLRLIGVVPWSGINIACGVCGVAISDCILGAFIGSLPWTAVTCQIGDILQTVASTPSPTPRTVSSLLTSPEIIFKLVFLSFLSLAPILGRERLRSLISHSAAGSPSSTNDADERMSRWTWVQDWRTKIRLSSRSRTREEGRNVLEVLVQEKGDLERLSS